MMWYMRVLVILGMVLALGVASQAQTPEPQSQPPPAEVTRRRDQRSRPLTKSGSSVRDAFL